jgi:hypothetical protein
MLMEKIKTAASNQVLEINALHDAVSDLVCAYCYCEFEENT